VSAPNREQLENNPVTELDGGIDGSQTTLDVVDGSVFPATGNFHIRIEDEILLCTSRSTNTLTVTRGVEGSSGAAHGDAVSVAQKVTTGAIETWTRDNSPMWAYSGGLPLNVLVADDGVTLLDSSDFTWVNQDGATATDQAGTIVTRHPVNSAASETKVRVLARTAPSAPYSYVAALQQVGPNAAAGNQRIAFGFRKNSTGAMTLINYSAVALSGAYKLAVLNYSSPTAFFNAARNEVFHCQNLPVLWLKIEDDNTNLKFYIGDGAEWILLTSVVRTVFITGGPDEIVWGGVVQDNQDVEQLVRLVHWSRAS
jgi:hypothetical protein